MQSLFFCSLLVLSSGILSLSALARETPTGMALYRQRGSLYVELQDRRWIKGRVLASLSVAAEVAWVSGLPQRIKLRFENPKESKIPFLPAEIVLGLGTESLPGIYTLNLESPPSGDFFLTDSRKQVRAGSSFGTIEVKKEGRSLVIRPLETISLRAYFEFEDGHFQYFRLFEYKASGEYCLWYSRYWACRKEISVKQKTELIELRLTNTKSLPQ